MAQELKAWFDSAFFQGLGDRLEAVQPGFDKAGFAAEAAHGLEALSLTQRMTRTVRLVRERLPADFRDAVAVLQQVAPAYEGQFVGMFMPEFVATYGRDDRAYSLRALAFFTRYSSAEFAVRHFLLDDLAGTLEVMLGWSGDANEHLRRLASEGSRPRLPWSFNLTPLIENPAPVKPILDRLNADPSAYVRKSVANHLNDISKDHPALMLDWVGAWDRSDDRTAWIAKHAARSLIKQGHQRAFALFDFEAAPQVEVDGFAIRPERLRVGDTATLSLTLVSTAGHDQKLAIDYTVHFVKKTGKTGPKVFKLKELILKPGERLVLERRHSFADRTIRTHHPGAHRVDIMVNGRVAATASLDLDRV